MSASPWRVDITPHKRSPNTQRPHQCRVPFDGELALAGVGVEATAVDLDLLLEMAGAELVVTGSVVIDWTGPCRRCLESQSASTPVTVREIFEKVPVEGETYRLEEDEVDLETMVRETVLLELPTSPLCSETCKGPDPDRFPASVASEVEDNAMGDEEPPTDPRWAALSEITFDE